MIETRQTVTVDRGIDDTWAYAKDFERWASIMPGYQTCEIEDADNSRWVLKIGVGSLVRTVKVRVHVEEWAGPERVDFAFKLEGDPVLGRGSYLAESLGTSQTAMTLQVQVEGSGPMAPMWEAMGGPVLPKFAKGFAEQLKERIEAATVEAAAPPTGFEAVRKPQSQTPRAGGFLAWLKRLWHAIFGKRD